MALALVSTYAVAEVGASVIWGSLAVIAAAGHMLTDVAIIAMALVAQWISGRAASSERTFGFQRVEVLAAMVNTLVLWLFAAWVLIAAYQRIFVGEVGDDHHHVEGWPVLIVGIGGVLIHLAAAWALRRSARDDLNVQGVFLHVIADVLGALGVVVAGVLILTLDWDLADPVLSAVIAVLMVYSTRRLVKSVMVVLLEGVPEHIDVYKLCSDIEDLEGVTVIHDVHVWTITSGSEAFTAHVIVDPLYTDTALLLERIKELVHSDFGISHVTVQLELSGASCLAENHHVEHLLAEARPAR